MKTQLQALFPWLTLAALADWLITRTLARAAIFIPKSSVLLQIYATVGIAGQFATSLVSLLSLIALGWIAWQHLRWQRKLILPLICIALLLVNLLSLFIPSAGWLTLSFQMALCSGILALLGQAWKHLFRLSLKIAISAIALTLLIGRLYQSLDAAYSALGLPGPPALSGSLYNSGELLVLFSIVASWWSFGRQARWYAWIIAILPAVVFTILRLLAPAMTGIMTIWSTGLTMYLPWPAYFIALWLAGVTVINSLQQDRTAGYAILLLAAGGYASQLSIQAFLGLIAMWMLVNPSAFIAKNSQAQVGYISTPRMHLSLLV